MITALMRRAFIGLCALALFSVPGAAFAEVQFVGAATDRDSPTLPSGVEAGDLVVAFAFWGYNAKAGTAPAGWTLIHSDGAQAHSARIAFRYVQSPSDNLGTWTDADAVITHVYRGTRSDYSSANLPAFGGPWTGNSTTLNFPSVSLSSPEAYLIWFGGQRETADINISPWVSQPFVDRSEYQTPGALDLVTAIGADTGQVTSSGDTIWADSTQNERWRTYTIALEEGEEVIVPPNVTSISAVGTNAAREYSAADTDGLIQLIGTDFGSATGDVVFSGLWGSVNGTIHAAADGSCSVGGWTDTSVCVEVPSSIPNDIYNVTVTLVRDDSESDVAPTLSILPRVSSISPSSVVAGDTVTISGDHLCQSGVCPTSLSSLNSVSFGGISATQLVSWSHTQVAVQVPSAASAGTQNVSVTTSGTAVSAGSITILSSVPSTPSIGPSATEGQFTTSDDAIAIGGPTSETQIVFKGSMTAGVSANLVFEVEVLPINTAFSGASTHDGSPVAYGGTGSVQGSVAVTLNDTESYHWRARVRNIDTGEASAWTAFGSNPSGDGSGDGVPASADFSISGSGPELGGIGTPPACVAHESVTDKEARISWTVDSSLSESAIENYVSYATSSDMTNAVEVQANNGSFPDVLLQELEAETTYYYSVRSVDELGLEASEPTTTPYCQFVTEERAKRINKLSEFYICQARAQNEDWSGGSGVSCASGDSGAKLFNVFVSEQTETKPVAQTSAFVEIFGVVEATQDVDISVSVNSAPVRTTSIKNPNGSISFRVLYPVESGFNLDYPADVSAENVLDIDIQGGSGTTTVSSLGAKAILNYYYFPF